MLIVPNWLDAVITYLPIKNTKRMLNHIFRVRAAFKWQDESHGQICRNEDVDESER